MPSFSESCLFSFKSRTIASSLNLVIKKGSCDVREKGSSDGSELIDSFEFDSIS